jgi:hypothetical protein
VVTRVGTHVWVWLNMPTLIEFNLRLTRIAVGLSEAIASRNGRHIYLELCMLKIISQSSENSSKVKTHECCYLFLEKVHASILIVINSSTKASKSNKNYN